MSNIEQSFTDRIFNNIRDEYNNSISTAMSAPENSFIYKYFYKEEILPFTGDPQYNYDPENTSIRKRNSFRCQLMAGYNYLYEKREAAEDTEELRFAKTLLMNVKKTDLGVDACEYTDGYITDEELSFFLPFFKAALSWSQKKVDEFRSSAVRKDYADKLFEIKEMLNASPSQMIGRLSFVKTAEYKTITDRILHSSIHNDIKKFMESSGFPLSEDNKTPHDTFKNDQIIRILNTYMAEVPDNSDRTQDKSQPDKTDKKTINMSEQEFEQLIQPFFAENNENIFLPIKSDPAGVGIYLIGRNFFKKNDINPKDSSHCHPGVVVFEKHYNTNHQNDDIAKCMIEIKIKTDFEKLSFRQLRQIYDEEVRKAAKKTQKYISFNTSHKVRFDKKRKEALDEMNESIKNAEEF